MHVQCLKCFAFIDATVVDDYQDQCPDCGEWTTFDDVSPWVERYMHNFVHGEAAPRWAHYEPDYVCRKCGADAVDCDNPEWYDCDSCGFTGRVSNLAE